MSSLRRTLFEETNNIMKEQKMEEKQERIARLAAKLATVAYADTLGITVEEAQSRVGDEEPGDWWTAVAAQHTDHADTIREQMIAMAKRQQQQPSHLSHQSAVIAPPLPGKSRIITHE